MNYTSSRLSVIKPSASAAVSEAAKKARAGGADIIDLGLGEPDFDTPEHIITAAHTAAQGGQTRYPPTAGTAELKAAVAAKLQRDNGLDYQPQAIIVSNGAKQVIFNAMMASLEPDDEVILCAPYFGQYKYIVLILGGVPKVISCSPVDGFRLTPEALAAAITPKTRWLLLNHPSNPAGTVYSDAELRALGSVLEQHPQVLILADEIYEHILFDGRSFTSFAAANPQLQDRTLTVNGVSKAYAMTGWRIGYGAGPEPLINGMVNVQSQISSGACSVAQAAAVAALNGPQDDVQRFCAAFERRRDLIVSRVADIKGLSLQTPGGAFYTLIGCEDLIGATTPDGKIIDDDVAFTQYLLSAAGIAAVPGSAYEASPYFRLSTATNETILTAAMDRLASCVAQLTQSA